MFRIVALLSACFLCSSLFAQSNSFTYLDEYCEPYFPGTNFPKLITPQWVGEDGVDAVVTLAIDDMRDMAKYEVYLRPILERLKQIDGRAPVSIMTCDIDPQDPQLQSWLAEGLTIEVHTVDHPCPCLQGGDFSKARSTYDRCVDLMASIPGNQSVAFRMPCCDSRNTPSPRFWMEAFNKRTAAGNFLQADSSVFNVFTPADKTLPRELVTESDGSSRFKKYIPFPSFVNTIENYPYPYVIGKLCWQFPCMVPSDWEAQNLQRPNNPKTVEDMKAALDATVIKRGMFNMVFHPHGWIRNDQIIELIDYAQEKYGKRVKFLNFKECVDRINENLLAGQPIRNPESGDDNGVRIVDLNRDGYLDVMIGNDESKVARVWEAKSNSWQDLNSAVQFVSHGRDSGVHFGQWSSKADVSLFVNNERDQSIYEFIDGQFKRKPLTEKLKNVRTSVGGVDQGVRLRDIDGDGFSDILIGNQERKAILRINDEIPLPFAIVDELGRDNGVRFVDIDSDGYDDLIVANGSESAIRLLEPNSGGFTKVVEGIEEIPPIVRGGTNNGVWFAKDHMWVQNEDTNRLPDGVDRRSFTQLLGKAEPGPRSPDVSLKSIKVRPGFSVELVAAEPLVMDPIALDWGPDGKLWVVEMADYPLGLDDKGKPGGRVRYLEDTNDDGKYDKSTLFLDEIAYPTGVIAWRDGVIVSAAPAVFFAADRDGDGKAEVREELYRGFGEGNQQHRVNGFERGLDHWLYLANGDSNGLIESVKTGKQVNISGRDLRIRPADGALEATSGRSQFGRHRDDHGNWFGCSNPLPVRHYVLADHYLRRNPHVVLPSAKRDIARVDNTQLFPISRVLSHWSGYKPPAPGSGHKFTSACSTMVYRDNLFGDEFIQNTFTCAPVHNAVHRRRLVPSGVTFESVRPEDESNIEFLASSDSWFRPTTVTTGPDGALWITDMYRLVIEHPEWIDDQHEKELFLRAGHDRGRIYRIYRTDRRPRGITPLGELTSLELVDQLSSPNGRVRDLAQYLLVERNDAAVRGPLDETVRSSPNPLARLHALCALGASEVNLETLQIALKDADPTVRRHAVRIAETEIGDQARDAEQILASLEKCDASDPHVKLQLAYSLGVSQSPRAAKLLAKLALASPDDEYLRAAVISSLGAHNLSDFRSALQRDEALANYQTAIFQMAVRINRPELLAELMDELIFDCSHDANAQNLNALATAIEIVRKVEGSLDQIQKKVLSGLGPKPALLASDSNEPIQRRVAAIRVLANLSEDSRSDVLSLVAATEPIEVQVAAIKGLAGKEMDALLERFKSLSPTVRLAILDESLAREATAIALADGVRGKTIPLASIGAAHRQKMKNHVSKKVQAIAAELFGDDGFSSDKQALLRNYKMATPSDGDVTLGQAVFTKQCSACHRVKGVGHDVGPILATLKNRSPQALLTAILDPNAAVEDKFRGYNVLTLDGVVTAGMIAGESSTAIEMRMQDGKSKTILRADVDRIQITGKSLMPEGMEKAISLSDMNHLLAFLNEMGSAPKQFDGNEPVGVQPSSDGTIELAATNCRIYGDQIRFEPQYKNIGFWGHPGDHVEWTLTIDRAGKYEVWLDYACPNDSAGNEFAFSYGDQTLAGQIKGTGTWNQYRQLKLGTIELPKSTEIARFSGTETLKSWLLDLRTIRLKPVGNNIVPAPTAGR